MPGQGVNGAKYVAALLSLTLGESTLREAIPQALRFVSARSPIRTLVQNLLSWYREDKNWQRTWSRINHLYRGLSPVHMLNNFAYVLLRLVIRQRRFYLHGFHHGHVWLGRGSADIRVFPICPNFGQTLMRIINFV